MNIVLSCHIRDVARIPRLCRPKVDSNCHRRSVRSKADMTYENFKHSRLTIERSNVPQPNVPTPKENLVFGQQFTPHMLLLKYENKQWSHPQIVPFQNLSISPAASGLHYGIQCFEGMKAYKPLLHSTEDKLEPSNEIRLFRPLKNMDRLASSMQRLSMPGYEFDPQELIHCIATLVRLDEAYIPTSTTPGYALYLRPTVIATHPFLGLSPPEHLLLYVLCSPVGPYYKASGFAPVKLLAASRDQIRAWPGGTGRYKIGGNYAPTMYAQQQAVQQGCGQVLWLLHDEITEVGAMNVFFVLQDGAALELVTPPLSRGDILPGVTRDSVLAWARTQWKAEVTVSERNITMTEVVEAIRTKRLWEAFGTGTAAVVVPIASIQYQGTEYSIPTGMEHSLTQRIWDAITGIQYGGIKGPEGWSVLVP